MAKEKIISYDYLKDIESWEAQNDSKTIKVKNGVSIKETDEEHNKRKIEEMRYQPKREYNKIKNSYLKTKKLIKQVEERKNGI